MLKVKQSWNEVTIKDFFHITSILKDDVLNDLEKKIAVLAVLAGIDETELDSYPISEVHKMFREVEFIYEQPKGEVKDYYFIGGKRYKLVKEVNRLTAAQFVDLSAYSKTSEDIIENLHLICTTLLLPAPFETRPLGLLKRISNKIVSRIKNTKVRAVLASVGIKEYQPVTNDLPVEKYLQTPQEETAENIFNNMKVSEAMGIAVFFYLLYMVSLKITEDYLGLELKNQLLSIYPQLETQKQKEMLKEIMEKVEIGFRTNTNGLQPLTA